MRLSEVKGLVLSQRRYRERDYLVKIFTDQYGKLMFLVRESKKSVISQEALQAFNMATYIVDVRSQGLSYLRDVKNLQVMKGIYGDIVRQAYATYLVHLADAAIEDRISHLQLLSRLASSILHINHGLDPAIISNIFEIQIMDDFGVGQAWKVCQICGQSQGRFDYSSQFNGILCPRHFYLDNHRYHASPQAIHYIRLFSQIDLSKIEKISVSDQYKKEIRQIIDQLYEENVGLHLKSKGFIDQLDKLKPEIDWSKRKSKEDKS